MLDYPALAALAAVVREGSFERAASVLGVTPSAVSQRVRLLEERLGAVLVTRGQPCVATAVGMPLCAHVERVRLLEGEVVATLPSLSGAGGDAPVTIRVAVNADSLGTWFLPAVAAFAEKHGAALDLVLDAEERTADRLRSGEVLAAVTGNPVPVQGCRTVALGGLRYVATASPSFMQRCFPDGVTALVLARAPVLRFDRNDTLQTRWAEAFSEAACQLRHPHPKKSAQRASRRIGQKISPEAHVSKRPFGPPQHEDGGVADGLSGVTSAAPTHWVPSTHGFVDAALAGLGWGLNPLALVSGHLEAGRLVEMVPDRRFDSPLYWQYARLGARWLDALTSAVVAAARRTLVAPHDPQGRAAPKVRR